MEVAMMGDLMAAIADGPAHLGIALDAPAADKEGLLQPEVLQRGDHVAYAHILIAQGG